MFFFPDVGALNPRFEFISLESIYFSVNLGTLYFITLFTLGLIIIGYPLRFFMKKMQYCKRCKANKTYIESFTLRTLIEGYYDFVLALSVNITAFEYSRGEFATLGVKLSNFLAFFKFNLKAFIRFI